MWTSEDDKLRDPPLGTQLASPHAPPKRVEAMQQANPHLWLKTSNTVQYNVRFLAYLAITSVARAPTSNAKQQASRTCGVLHKQFTAHVISHNGATLRICVDG